MGAVGSWSLLCTLLGGPPWSRAAGGWTEGHACSRNPASPGCCLAGLSQDRGDRAQHSHPRWHGELALTLPAIACGLPGLSVASHEAISPSSSRGRLWALGLGTHGGNKGSCVLCF